MSKRLTRSELLTGGARAGTVLVLAGSGLGVFAATADATPPNDSIGALAASDLAYARLLIGWELLSIDFYTNALRSKHLDRPTGDVFRLVLANETAHYTYLAGVLAGSGTVALTADDISFTYPTGAFYTARSVTKLATTLEGLTLGTALGAGGNVANAALASAISQIATNEAQHLATLAIGGGKPAFQDAFPATMTMEDSSNALASYTS